MQGERQLTLAPPQTPSEKVPRSASPLAEFSYRLQWYDLLSLGLFVAWAILKFFVIANILFLIAGIINGLMAVRTLTRRYYLWDVKIYQFPEGLALIRQDQMTAFLWEEIDTIEHQANVQLLPNLWSFIIKGFSLRFVVQRWDGAQLTFNDFLPKYNKLWEIIQQETLPVLLPRVLKSYRAGKTVSFGPLRLNLGGLSYGKKMLAWRDVEEISIDSYTVSIQEKDRWWPWFKVSTTRIPNVLVFQSMTDLIQQEMKSLEDGQSVGQEKTTIR
jgi:hypothetical protein